MSVITIILRNVNVINVYHAAINQALCGSVICAYTDGRNDDFIHTRQKNDFRYGKFNSQTVMRHIANN